MNTNDQLDRLLADLDENAAAPADTTVRNLHAELATLADDLRQPLPADPHADESALRRAVALVRDIGRNPSPATLANAAALGRDVEPAPLGDIGPYRLLAKLGQGGMGTVYKALHTRLEKVVALKVLSEERTNSAESIARFNREMKAVGNIDHPHIVRATDAGETDGTHYLVMEYVEGVDLAELLKRNGPLPVPAACELVRQAALGLQAAHARGMVHRDVKPANLMLARQEFGPPVVKVLDLGLALLAETHAPDATGLTSHGHIMGTIDFMAPEQAGDSHTVDGRADVYSLGATLYALLTGGSIFHGREFKTVMQKLSALANESATPIRERRGDVPEELATTVHRMLARDPAERPATPADVIAALAPHTTDADLPSLIAVAQPQPDGTSPTAAWPAAARQAAGESPSRPPNPPRAPRRKSAIAGGIFLAMLASLGLTLGLVYLAGILFKVKTPDGTLVVEVDDPKNVVVEIDGKQAQVNVTADGKALELSITPGTRQLVVKTADGTVLKTDGGKKVEIAAGKMRRIRAWVEKATVGSGRNVQPPTNTALRFDGKDDVVEIPTLKDTLATAATLEAWLTVENRPAGLPTLVEAGGFKMRLLQSAMPQWMFIAYGTKTPELTAVPGFARTGVLTHVAGVYDGKQLRLYIDGKVYAHWTLPPGFTPKRQRPFATLGGTAANEPKNAFRGTIHALRISTTARYDKDFTPDRRFASDKDTLALYRFEEGQGTKVADSSGRGHHGKIVGATWVKLPNAGHRWIPTPAQQQFFDAVAQLPGDRQIAPVAERLKALNPEFDGKLDKFVVAKGRVVRLYLPKAPLRELWPLAALTTLEELDISHIPATNLAPIGRLTALRSLNFAGVDVDRMPFVARLKKLESLDCSDTWVRDLSPLAGLPLKTLRTFAVSTYNKPARGVLKTCPKLESINGLPLKTFLARRDELERLRKTLPAYSAERQLALVVEKLKEFNPGFDGRLQMHGIEKGIVTDVQLYNNGSITDVSPLAVLPLTNLGCAATRVSDLSALKGMPLRTLSLSRTRVSDLSPLKGMPLTQLHCGDTRVSDLSPLNGMPLTWLNCHETRVSDLSPLKGMPLTTLFVSGTRVSDLSPLKNIRLTSLGCATTRVSDLTALTGMPLRQLNCDNTGVTDLAPLKGMPLRELAVNSSAVADLSPLEGMPLTSLQCQKTRVSDLSPLKGMKLTSLECGSTRVSDLSPLKRMPLRELAINSSAVADLSPLEGMPLTSLQCQKTRVSDLSPLKGMKLTSLECHITGVKDLSPLAGMKLTYLNCHTTGVKDLSPLMGMPLTWLTCSATQVADLTPLKGMPLKTLLFNGTPVWDLSPLKGMKLTELQFGLTRVSDLSPLKGIPLSVLTCDHTRVSNLAPLKELPLKTIWIDLRLFHKDDETLLRSLPLQTISPDGWQNPQPAAVIWNEFDRRRRSAQSFATATAKLSPERQVGAVVDKLKNLNPNVAIGPLRHTIENGAVTSVTLGVQDKSPTAEAPTISLTPLRAFTKLKKLTLTDGPYWLDISAINSLPLEELTCTADIALRNAPVLRGMKTLQTTNGQPAAKYLDSLIAAAKAKR